MAFKLDLTDIALAVVFLFVGVEHEGHEFDSVAEEHVLVHLFVLSVLLRQHGVRVGEEIEVEGLWVRVKGRVNVARKDFEFSHELSEQRVLCALQVSFLDCALQKINKKSECLVLDRLDFAHRDDGINLAGIRIPANKCKHSSFLGSTQAGIGDLLVDLEQGRAQLIVRLVDAAHSLRDNVKIKAL